MMKTMRALARVAAVAAIALLALAAIPAHAGERYQMISLSAGAGFAPDKALILDTASGHLWLWVENAGSDDQGGSRYLIYQGQLRPGTEMGEIIERQEWPAGR